MDFSTILNWIAAHHTVLISIAVGALGLSVTLETLLTKFKVQSKKLAFSLLHIFSALTGVATFFMGLTGKQAFGTYAGLALAAEGWHRFVVSDVNTKYVTPFLTWLANQKTATQPTANTVNPTITSTTTSTAPAGITSQTLNDSAPTPPPPMTAK